MRVHCLLLCLLLVQPALAGRDTITIATFETGDLSEWAGNQEFVLLDFEDSVLHDETWLLGTPVGTQGIVVAPKGDSGACDLSIAPGEGRGGSNAMLVNCVDAAAGDPGFWVLKHSNQGYLANFKNDDGYLLPAGRRANRAELWIRLQPGFQAASAAAQPPAYPNHQNFHFGTYHFDPAKINGSQDVKESDNWHFYFQIFVRHDKANGDWVHLILNELPQHQRSINALPPDNPTAAAGDFWEILTRFYVDVVPYFSDPEIAYPVKMWVDDIKLTYVAENQPIAVRFTQHQTGAPVDVTMTQVADFNVEVRNSSTAEICGHISQAAYWTLNMQILSGGTTIGSGDLLCVPAASTIALTVRLNPNAGSPDGTVRYAGMTFVSNDQLLSDTESASRSLSDERVERRWYPETGPFDGVVAGDFIRAVLRQ